MKPTLRQTCAKHHALPPRLRGSKTVLYQENTVWLTWHKAAKPRQTVVPSRSAGKSPDRNNDPGVVRQPLKAGL